LLDSCILQLAFYVALYTHPHHIHCPLRCVYIHTLHNLPLQLHSICPFASCTYLCICSSHLPPHVVACCAAFGCICWVGSYAGSGYTHTLRCHHTPRAARLPAFTVVGSICSLHVPRTRYALYAHAVHTRVVVGCYIRPRLHAFTVTRSFCGWLLPTACLLPTTPLHHALRVYTCAYAHTHATRYAVGCLPRISCLSIYTPPSHIWQFVCPCWTVVGIVIWLLIIVVV